MSKIERICPNCGATNASDRARCVRCGTNLTTLPAKRGASLPARAERVSATALVLGASALIARVGWSLVARQVLPRLVKGLTSRAAPRQVVKQPSEKQVNHPPEEQADYVIRGWRTWSVRRGDEQAQGSEHFEWKITRRGEGGAGRRKE